ncbi:hypothetical protein AM593_03257, partial [Mytilus galloprovincialis]
LFVCGTNADAPKGFEINTTSGVTTYGSEHQNSSKADDIYYGSTLHSESTIQRPIPRSTDYMKGVISNKWMKGT